MSIYRFARPHHRDNLDFLVAEIAEQDGVSIEQVRAKVDPHPNADNHLVLATTNEIDHWPSFRFGGCPTCKGRGHLDSTRCPQCDGLGVVDSANPEGPRAHG